MGKHKRQDRFRVQNHKRLGSVSLKCPHLGQRMLQFLTIHTI